MPRFHHSRTVLVALMLLLGWHVSAQADASMTLQVTSSSSGSDTVELSLADLDAMEQVTYRTTTLWTDGMVTFSGVPLAKILAKAGVQGTAIQMKALNDYQVEMPLSVLEESIPLVATRMNGEQMSVRDKGPYWVVFPYDQSAKYQTETIYSYSIWQLDRLRVIN